MSSEIELVEEVVPSQDRDAAASTSNEAEESRDDVYTAAAYGDMEKLVRLVEREGCSVTEPDGLGYSALQWAALNNRTAAATYILQHGGDVHAADHTRQTALHWCAVRGAIQVAELLMQEGARVNAADMYGYQQNGSQSWMRFLNCEVAVMQCNFQRNFHYGSFGNNLLKSTQG